MTTASPDVELAIVRTQEGANRYGVPIGSEVGSRQKPVKPLSSRALKKQSLLTPETQNRIKEYQRKNGLPQTGQLDPETVAHTRLAGAENKQAKANAKAAKEADAAKRRADADRRREEADKRRETNAAESQKRREESDRRRAESDKRREDSDKRRDEKEKERLADKAKREKDAADAKAERARLAEQSAQGRFKTTSKGQTLTKAQVDALLRRRGIQLSNDGQSVYLNVDIELGQGGSKWRHGWVPLNAIAAAIKAKKYKGSREATPTAKIPGPRGSKRPTAGSRPASVPRSKAAPTAEQRKRAVAQSFGNPPAAARVERVAAAKSVLHRSENDSVNPPTSAERDAAKATLREERANRGKRISTFPHASEIGKKGIELDVKTFSGVDQFGQKITFKGRSHGSSRATRKDGLIGTSHSVHNGSDFGGLDATSRAHVFEPFGKLSAHELSEGGAELRTADGKIVTSHYPSKLAATRAANRHNKALAKIDTDAAATARTDGTFYDPRTGGLNALSKTPDAATREKMVESRATAFAEAKAASEKSHPIGYRVSAGNGNGGTVVGHADGGGLKVKWDNGVQNVIDPANARRADPIGPRGALNPTDSQLIARAEAMHGTDRTRWSGADLKSAAAKGDDAARTEIKRRAALAQTQLDKRAKRNQRAPMSEERLRELREADRRHRER